VRCFSQAAIGGFIFGCGLSFSLGPQNLRLIRAGMTGGHPAAVATTGYISEVLIVTAGIGGIGATIAERPWISAGLQVAGVAFLLWCGLRSLSRRRAHVRIAGSCAPDPRGRAIASMLAVTWLNPLVYVEAMLLVGVISSGYASEARIWFAAGFLVASAIKFYGWSLVGAGFSTWLDGPTRALRFDAVSGLLLIAAATLLAAHIAAGA
jgi:L-lysine exporter family protein LysE/ArgO